MIQSERAKNIFVILLLFDKDRSYELSVEEMTARVEISEQGETNEETPIAETESFDDNLSENTQEQQLNEEIM
ncbi:hypothetical protein [Enterococcus mundtii]|uniref:hypothetical protein n=1 Tax=Enterococcus mundtii TaxID=53346 RepID=UPI001FB8D378|nr:hypothetical protein [Enterococcus mundtii]GKS55961.1 hypothetical protein EMLAB_25760 [Enterococcus mundtii]